MPESENSFQREVLDRLKTIEVKIDNYDKVKEQVYQNQRDILDMKNTTRACDEQIKQEQTNQNEKIKAIQDTNKWLARTIGATLIAIVIAVIVGSIRLGVGG